MESETRTVKGQRYDEKTRQIDSKGRKSLRESEIEMETEKSRKWM